MARRRVLKGCAVLWSVVFLAAAAPAATVSLRLEKYPDLTPTGRGASKTPPNSYYPVMSRLLDVSPSPPAGKWDLPKVPEGSLYAVFPMGDAEQLLILAPETSGDLHCSRLYFDRNGDGKLSREAPLVGESQSDSYRTTVRFPPVDAKIQADKKPVVYSFRVEVSYFTREGGGDDPNKPYVRIYSNCCFSGALKMSGKTFLVVLGDGNVNGRFDDNPAPPDPKSKTAASTGAQRMDGDRIYLAPVGMKMDERHGSMLGGIMVFRDKTFKVDLSQASKKLNLTPFTKDLGTLKVPMKVTFMSLYGTTEKTSVVIVAPSEKVKIPKDTYKLLEYRVISNDPQGDVWFLSASGSEETPTCTVGKDIAEPKFGEPFVPTADVSPGSGSSVRLVFKLVGSAGEEVTDVQHLEGNRTKIPMAVTSAHRPREATYTIVTETGEVVAQGTFRYG
jgi:hypothetical protein